MIYEIKFKADLTADDVRAMKKYFFDTMNESMEISDLWDLELTKVEDNPKVSIPRDADHIDVIVDGLYRCKTLDEVADYLDAIPRKFGEWWVDIIPDGDGNPICEVTNEWWDEQCEEFQCDTYELEIEVRCDDE